MIYFGVKTDQKVKEKMIYGSYFKKNKKNKKKGKRIERGA